MRTCCPASRAASCTLFELLKHVWVHVRRYMEDGPKTLIEHTPVVLPIADKREGFIFGWHDTDAIDGPMLLAYLFIDPDRRLAMHTSKIPDGREIEQQCLTESADAFVRDANTNPPAAR